MGRAYRGPYARPSTVDVPYATAAVWGTGWNPIHQYYGEGPPLRVIGRSGAIGSSPVGGSSQDPRSRGYQDPANSAGLDPPEMVTWGYEVDYGVDSFGSGANASPWKTAPATDEYMDDRPAWNDPTQQDNIRRTSSMTPWNRTGEALRAFRGGARRVRLNSSQPYTAEPSNGRPNESVSEGWLNKATSFVADAEPSADEQVFVQTSMRQRYGVRNNNRATARGTDGDRAQINSRVMPMVEKVYSTGERLYDMFPYQADEIIRPFRYRTAATGRQRWMEANYVTAWNPIQRTPPAEPALGVPEVSAADDYGYTQEDTMYYG